MPETPRIVLASTSRYRRELLERLKVPFVVHAPQVDETPGSSEPPPDVALRLAREKALNGAERFPASIVIGSDQVAELRGSRVGKPQTHEAAIAQLLAMQGQQVVFHTAIAVIGKGEVQIDSVPTTVTFRRLRPNQLERYLRIDEPYDCAGSAKIESLGIALIERVEANDPTALIGLPLIRLTSMLAAADIDVLAP
jgi:septum formation protein